MSEQNMLDTARKQAETTVNDLVDFGHKSLLVGLGSVGTAQDAVNDLIKWTTDFYETSLKRGTEIEKQVTSDVDRVWKESQERVEEVSGDLEALVRKTIERLTIPTREDLKVLAQKIDEVEAKIRARLGVQVAPLVEAVIEAPFENYDNLTAKEILNRLPDLTISELQDVRVYEMAHGERVTVLREVNRRIDAMPIAGYDDMTVEQIVPRLVTLDEAQLAVIAQYERAHSGRVGVLDTIEKRMTGLEMMGA